MPEMPKRIDFDDIREGDTIRVVDVHDVVVKRKAADEFLYGESGAYLRENLRPGSNRKFQLVGRPRDPLPAKAGSIIRVNGETWALTVRRGMERPHWLSLERGAYRSQGLMERMTGEFEVIL